MGVELVADFVIAIDSSSIADNSADLGESKTDVNTPADMSGSIESVSRPSTGFLRLRMTNITLLQSIDSMVCWSLPRKLADQMVDPPSAGKGITYGPRSVAYVIACTRETWF